MKLRDFPTLRHVVKFVYDSRPIWRLRRGRSPKVKRRKKPRPRHEERWPRSDSCPSSLRRKGAGGPAPAPPAADDVVQKVLAIVAEKTGYPAEMLELDLDLEADLGVDTVKQAETFAAVRAEWDIPRRTA